MGSEKGEVREGAVFSSSRFHDALEKKKRKEKKKEKKKRSVSEKKVPPLGVKQKEMMHVYADSFKILGKER